MFSIGFYKCSISCYMFSYVLFQVFLCFPYIFWPYVFLASWYCLYIGIYRFWCVLHDSDVFELFCFNISVFHADLHPAWGGHVLVSILAFVFHSWGSSALRASWLLANRRSCQDSELFLFYLCIMCSFGFTGSDYWGSCRGVYRVESWLARVLSEKRHMYIQTSVQLH